MKIGILEQLQKGVTVPSKAPKILPFHPFIPPRITFVFSGGKNDCIIPIVKIKTDKRIKILIVSNIKNCRLLPSLLSNDIPKNSNNLPAKSFSQTILKTWSLTHSHIQYSSQPYLKIILRLSK
ncbi:hypothetical protein RV07_GL002888 [Enterococcus malodoratus]|nr:hypothetical protein RV07_GL002888 [Enterococcus malodoratus]